MTEIRYNDYQEPHAKRRKVSSLEEAKSTRAPPSTATPMAELTHNELHAKTYKASLNEEKKLARTSSSHTTSMAGLAHHENHATRKVSSTKETELTCVPNPNATSRAGLEHHEIQAPSEVPSTKGAELTCVPNPNAMSTAGPEHHEVHAAGVASSTKETASTCVPTPNAMSTAGLEHHESHATSEVSATKETELAPVAKLGNEELHTRKRKSPSYDEIKLPLPPAVGLLIKKHSDKAKLPTRGSHLAAGYDLYSAERKTIPARGRALIDTQISIAMPEGTYGRIAPRSGLAWKYMIDTGAGVVDADYRGIVQVLLFNLSEKDFEVDEGDRVAQLILERVCTPDVFEVQDLDVTLRGASGFGSTGGHAAL